MEAENDEEDDGGEEAGQPEPNADAGQRAAVGAVLEEEDDY